MRGKSAYLPSTAALKSCFNEARALCAGSQDAAKAAEAVAKRLQ